MKTGPAAGKLCREDGTAKRMEQPKCQTIHLNVLEKLLAVTIRPFAVEIVI